ncbi:DUF86 domain-containing protein [Paenibacillus sanguinis]|uniref:DUF86 domain-containing protein n=1 Tax=Paenibacillus sanguinis TaxID=225906 RepID=UPI00036B39E3|nr:HepT-like ribonuclease domain-containing protein [Paenibacillus sanguinis]
MYYVNREQIERRLEIIPELLQVLGQMSQRERPLIERYAQERALHLAVEIVTDVGSYLIDGFIMRDASSYEDIVDIMLDEKVIDRDMHAVLVKLVRLRKPLVQEYFLSQQETDEWTQDLPEVLETFSTKVLSYLEQEGVYSPLAK